MTRRAWRAAPAALVLVSSCHRQAAPAPVPVAPAPVVAAPASSATTWATTLAEAQRAHENGAFAAADSLLLQFGLANAGSAEGAEADFWRAVIKADPAYPAPSPRERIALFDAYLAAGPSAPHYVEAVTYRRLLEAMDSTRTFIAQLRSSSEARMRSREDEIRKLSDDLDRALAELERIKKRLAPAKPPPPSQR